MVNSLISFHFVKFVTGDSSILPTDIPVFFFTVCKSHFIDLFPNIPHYIVLGIGDIHYKFLLFPFLSFFGFFDLDIFNFFFFIFILPIIRLSYNFSAAFIGFNRASFHCCVEERVIFSQCFWAISN